MGRINAQSIVARTIDRNSGERCKLLGYRQRNVRQVGIARRIERNAATAADFNRTGSGPRNGVENRVGRFQGAARVIDTVTGTKDRFIFAEPRKRITDTDGRSKGLVVVVIQLTARM